MLGSNTSKSFGNRINNLLILRPETRPLKIIDIPRWTLGNDKLAQRLNHTAPPHDTPHSRKPGVIPPRHKTLIDKPLQLALAQHRPHEIEPRKANDFDGTHAQRLEHPRVLRVSVLVFERAEGVGDAFQAVDDGTRKVIRRVDFVLAAGAVVGGVVAAVDDGIAEGFVFVVDGDFGSDAVSLALMLQRRVWVGVTSGVNCLISLKRRMLSWGSRSRHLLAIPSIRCFRI